MPQHVSRCVRKYWKSVQKHASLDCVKDTAQFERTSNTIQLGFQGEQGRNASRLNSDDSPTPEDEDQPLRIVREHNFDARLSGDALTWALMFFEEMDDKKAYKEALVAAFRLNITFDCQSIRPHEERDVFYYLAELALMIDEVNRGHASINATGRFGMMTIMHLACISGIAELLELLFWRGAIFDKLDEYDVTALNYAVRSGDLDTVIFALALGADPNLGSPFTSASSDGRRDIMMALVKYGADVDEKDSDGDTALKRAIEEESFDEVRFLLSLGADANLALDDDAHPMFGMIAGCEHQDMDTCVREQISLTLVEHGVNIQTRSQGYSGRSLFHLAVRGAHTRLLRALLSRTTCPDVLNATDDIGWNSLHYAAVESNEQITHENFTMLSMLIEAGADINSRSNNGYTTLDLAAGDGNEALVKLLLDAGADITTSPDCKHSALTLAARKGNERVARMLIAARADVNWQDEDGDSALIIATEGDHVEIILLLLDAGADIDTRTRGGETALFIAVAYNYESTVRLLIDAGADVDAMTEMDETALSLAVDSLREDTVRQLLAAGASIDTRFLVEPMWTFVETVLGESEFRARAKLHPESYENDGPRGW
jgi:ankyrin repeat protein